MSIFPADVDESKWNGDNLGKWRNAQLSDSLGFPLEPLDAKALHVIGLLARTFEAAGRLLSFSGQPKADYYLQAYLIACSAIELLARCKNGDESFMESPNEALRQGFIATGIVKKRMAEQDDVLVTNEETYSLEKLVALRNLAAHGGGVASIKHQPTLDVFLHIELLDTFPTCLCDAFDCYYRDLRAATYSSARENLARSGLAPVLYANRSGQAFVSPIRYAYKCILAKSIVPSQAMQYRDWQVYK